MSREKECKWYFDKHSGLKQGDVLAAMAQMFTEKPYNSLVRESIQNSLDAVLDKNYPVKVEFTFKKFNSLDFPNFFDLKNHFKATAEYFADVEKYHTMYTNMYNIMPDKQWVGSINYLQISDYNANGMKYDATKPSSPFDSFVRSAGVPSHEDNSSGGAFGFGHSAYFQLSPFRTVLVSTLTKDDQYFFEGTTNIGTHLGKQNGRDILLAGVGYYDNNDGEPISDPNRIPNPFKRREVIQNAPHPNYKYGTDIDIVGLNLDDTDEVKDEMISSVLENYWFAIFSNKLEVSIDGYPINSGNLDYEITSRYSETIDPTDKIINPRPYYEAVKYEGSPDGMHPSIVETDKVLGNIKLYTFLNENAPSDKIVFMRQPKMMVFRQRYRNSKGLYGVFLCEDEMGNEALRKIENSSHTEWKKENFTDVYKKVMPEAKLTEQAYIDFIERCKKEIFSSNNSTQEDIGGEFLPTIDDDEDSTLQTKTYVGTTAEDGNAITSNIDDKDRKYRTPQGNISIINGDITENEGNARIHVRKTGANRKMGSGTSSGKTNTGKGGGETGKNSYSVVKDYYYRIIGYRQNGIILHKLIVNVNKDIPRASIVISVASEKQSDDKVALSYVSFNGQRATISNEIVENINLLKGRNVLEIKLQDNIEHSLNIEVHEN